MRDSGGNEEGEDDEGSEDGPSMRSMNVLNDNQPASALHAEIAIYLHSLMGERVDAAGLDPAESVAGRDWNPLGVPMRVDVVGLRPTESVAGGHGNPPRVPV
jgi:hypothetical protein